MADVEAPLSPWFYVGIGVAVLVTIIGALIGAQEIRKNNAKREQLQRLMHE
jgi:hypothetical protein